MSLKLTPKKRMAKAKVGLLQQYPVLLNARKMRVNQRLLKAVRAVLVVKVVWNVKAATQLKTPLRKKKVKNKNLIGLICARMMILSRARFERQRKLKLILS